LIKFVCIGSKDRRRDREKYFNWVVCSIRNDSRVSFVTTNSNFILFSHFIYSLSHDKLCFKYLHRFVGKFTRENRNYIFCMLMGFVGGIRENKKERKKKKKNFVLFICQIKILFLAYISTCFTGETWDITSGDEDKNCAFLNLSVM
jgi:hypothetical protein